MCTTFARLRSRTSGISITPTCFIFTQALAREEHELAEADSRFLVVDGLRVHYKAAPAPDDATDSGVMQSSFKQLCLACCGIEQRGSCSAELPHRLLAPARLTVLLHH